MMFERLCKGHFRRYKDSIFSNIFLRLVNCLKSFAFGHIQKCPFWSTPLHFRNASAASASQSGPTILGFTFIHPFSYSHVSKTSMESCRSSNMAARIPRLHTTKPAMRERTTTACLWPCWRQEQLLMDGLRMAMDMILLETVLIGQIRRKTMHHRILQCG